MFRTYRSDDAFDVLAVTFLPIIDDSSAKIRQLIVPKKIGSMSLSSVSVS